jgi:hypothetical protein
LFLCQIIAGIRFQIAKACCTLHNICEIHGDVFDDDWLEGVDHEGENVNREQNDENQMNLMCGSSTYATDQPLYPATQSGYRGPDYYSTSDVLGDVRKSNYRLSRTRMTSVHSDD